MVASAASEISGLRCASICCIVFGVLMLPSIHVSIPALTVGCMITCAPKDTAGIKPQLGCARCCSITGIVFAVLEVIGCVIVGILFLTVLHDSCLTVNQLYGCSRRSLKVVPADASFPTLAMSTPSFVPPWVVAEISFGISNLGNLPGISSFGHLPPLYRRDKDGTLAELPFDISPSGEVEINPLVGKRAAPIEVAANADKNAQRKLQTECSYGCLPGYISNGDCDFWCNNAECNYDGGDCASHVDKEIAVVAEKMTSTVRKTLDQTRRRLQSYSSVVDACNLAVTQMQTQFGSLGSLGDTACTAASSSLVSSGALSSYTSLCSSISTSAFNGVTTCSAFLSAYGSFCSSFSSCGGGSSSTSSTSYSSSPPPPSPSPPGGGACSYGCPPNYISDGICDSPCNNYVCNYDGGDCSGSYTYYTSSACGTIDDICGWYTGVGYFVTVYPTLLSICLIFAFSFVLRHAGAIDTLPPGASGATTSSASARV